MDWSLDCERVAGTIGPLSVTTVPAPEGRRASRRVRARPKEGERQCSNQRGTGARRPRAGFAA